MTAAEALGHLLQALERGEAVAEVVALDGVQRPGERLLVRADGGTIGSLGSAALDRAARDAGVEALRAGRAGVVEPEQGGVRFFVEPHHGVGDLVIVGAGHIAQPLCSLGALLGYRVLVVDDRPEFATRERFPEAHRVLRADMADLAAAVPLGPRSHLVLVTRGHKYDYEVLRQVLLAPARPAYIGMIGSQRRVRAAMEELAREGVAHQRLAEVYAPIGLELGAESPAEIAVAIAAELVLLRRGGGGGHLRDRARVMERWIDG